MSRKWHISFRFRHVLRHVASIAIGLAGIWSLQSCAWIQKEDVELDPQELHNGTEGRDPLPGELVQKILMEDSIRSVKNQELKNNMAGVIRDYSKRFRERYFNGYFLTDLNDDDIPELWVRVGNYRDNSKLELFYPMPDGSLKKSDTFAEPGQYYLGDNYMMQVVSAGPGYININKIDIHNGLMNVENIRELDLYADPNAQIPTFTEREIRDIPFSNLGPLYQAFKTSNEPFQSGNRLTVR